MHIIIIPFITFLVAVAASSFLIAIAESTTVAPSMIFWFVVGDLDWLAIFLVTLVSLIVGLTVREYRTDRKIKRFRFVACSPIAPTTDVFYVEKSGDHSTARILEGSRDYLVRAIEKSKQEQLAEEAEAMALGFATVALYYISDAFDGESPSHAEIAEKNPIVLRRSPRLAAHRNETQNGISSSSESLGSPRCLFPSLDNGSG